MWWYSSQSWSCMAPTLSKYALWTFAPFSIHLNTLILPISRSLVTLIFLLWQKLGSLLHLLVLNYPTLLHLHGFTLISCRRPTPATKSHKLYVSLITSLPMIYSMINSILFNLLTPNTNSTQIPLNRIRTSALLSVYDDHIIKAMSQQKITALCPLDLSATFDTIDHSILTHRSSS